MFWSKILLISLVFLCTESQRRGACPRDFVQLGDNCYHFSVTEETWMDAHYKCVDSGGKLALVKKKWQDKLLRNYLMNADTAPVTRWIGGIWGGKLWMWGTSGDPLRYRGFAKRFRKNANRENFNWKCIGMNPEYKYRWQPRICVERLHFICEAPPVGTRVAK